MNDFFSLHRLMKKMNGPDKIDDDSSLRKSIHDENVK
jgi:hypothetical protein